MAYSVVLAVLLISSLNLIVILKSLIKAIYN